MKVTSIEIRPGDPSVVHHAIVQIPEQTIVNTPHGKFVLTVCADCTTDAQIQKVEKAFAARPVVVDDVARQGGSSYSDQLSRARELMTGQGVFTTMEAVYAPGSPPLGLPIFQLC